MPPKAASIAMKPGASPAAQSPQNGDVTIQTTKTWVLPERPKPGRKPSNNSPPTKRKAQNRDAQRAFRERRAQRVGELEQQIREMEAEHRQQLEQVELEKTALYQDVARMRETLEQLERENTQLKRAAAMGELGSAEGAAEVSIRRSRLGHQIMRPIQQVASPSPSVEASSPRRTSISFASIDEAMLGQTVPLRRRNKRTTTGLDSPLASAPASLKRLKSEEPIIEQDFTTANLPYRFRPGDQDGCGFCSDGTPCLCAEAAQSAAKSLVMVQSRSNSRDASALDTLASIAEEDNGLCSGNPGSCKQCQLDPMSTLFCRTLASQSPPGRPSLSSNPSEIGMDRPMLPRANSLTFTTSSLRDSTPPPVSARGQAFIPCSAAYQTLSRHANFDDSDLGTLVSGLQVDKADGKGVSVSSVRDALRSLDRGFGRGV